MSGSGGSSDDGDLDTAVAELSRLAMGSVHDSLTQIAALTVQAVPGADGAGVTMLEPGRREVYGTCGPFVAQVDDLQYRLDEGPCVSAAAARCIVTSGALGTDPQWPRFGPQVHALGVNSVLSVPLLVSKDVVGALNVYSRARDAFGRPAVAASELFAVPAAVAVFNARLLEQTRRLADQLQTALTSRAVIDQAIGISMSRQGISAAQALVRLREASQARNVKLSALAAQLVDEAVRRARARHLQP